jgi:transposase
MKALSEDFRERIVSAYEAGEGSYEVLAARFAVGPTVVGKLVRQKRELGTLAPQVHRRGRKPAVAGKKEAELREHLRKRPDATVLERREALGLKCSEKTLWQTLRKMGWRFKKSRRVQPSKIARTLP